MSIKTIDEQSHIILINNFSPIQIQREHFIIYKTEKISCRNIFDCQRLLNETEVIKKSSNHFNNSIYFIQPFIKKYKELLKTLMVFLRDQIPVKVNAK